MPSVDIGTGTTVDFGTSSFSMELIDVNHDGIERESNATSHMGTTGGMTFIPGDLYDPGTLELEGHFDPSDTVPIDQAAEPITITYPDGSTDIASGFITSVGRASPLEGVMIQTISVKLTGDITGVPGIIA